jgi:hypothetical protein
MPSYPKRLIEVDLPIARISAHARREKSIRHGHISTLHIWWARRPLAACRAVICAALWPDPADPLCPAMFREKAIVALQAFAARVFPPRVTAEEQTLKRTASVESLGRWEPLAAGTLTLDANVPGDLPIVRLALLDFIADFANWDNSTVPAYLETSRALTQAAHEALGGEPGTRPLVWAADRPRGGAVVGHRRHHRWAGLIHRGGSCRRVRGESGGGRRRVVRRSPHQQPRRAAARTTAARGALCALARCGAAAEVDEFLHQGSQQICHAAGTEDRGRL